MYFDRASRKRRQLLRMRTRPGRVCASRERKKLAVSPLAPRHYKALGALCLRRRRCRHCCCCSRDVLLRKKAKEAESRWIVVSSLPLCIRSSSVRPSPRPPYRCTSTGQRVKVIARHASQPAATSSCTVRDRTGPRASSTGFIGNTARSDLCRSPATFTCLARQTRSPVCFPNPATRRVICFTSPFIGLSV